MDKYYYMVAQLPTLVFDRDPGMDIPTFLEEAGKWLSRRDFDALKDADLNDLDTEKGETKTLRSYRDFEHSLRYRIAAWRRSMRGGEALRRPDFPASLVKEGNPLDVEKKLLRHRWNFIEAMETEHDFDLDFLILYFLKLQILDRLSRFDAKRGIASYDDIVGAEYVAGDPSSSGSTEKDDHDST